LRPKYAYELLGTVKPEGEIEPPATEKLTEPPVTSPHPPPGLEMYDSVTISALLDWKKWAEFHEAVILPLVKAGAKLNVRVEVEGKSDEDISPNTVNLAVKESLVQYGITANVETKQKSDSAGKENHNS
jgi:hypothetical protein